MAKPFEPILEWVAENFRKDASKMLIYTGVAGWTLSSLAQIFGIVINPKIKKEQKGFLVPQEFADAAVNISCFFLVTQFTKRTVAKLFSTGKFAPKSVRKYLAEHANLYSDKIGKVGFDLDEVLKKDKANFPVDAYYMTKNYGTTLATVGAGIISSNIITPIIRNAMASHFQKNYISVKTTLEANKPDKKENNKPVFKSCNPNGFGKYYNLYSNGSMKI